MKLYRIATVLCLLTIGVAHAEGPQQELKTDRDRLSYAVGVETARAIVKGEADLDQELVIQGMRDAMANRPLLAPEADLRRLMNTFRGQIYTRTAQSRRVVTDSNRRREQAFLSDNAKKDGVKTLANGIQYKVVAAGQGKPPIDSDTVEMKVRGTLLDGSEFATSGNDGPMRQKLNVVGPAGLKEALHQMPVGAHWQLWVPSKLGYGERGVGEDIGPNELLVFDLELVGAHP